MNLSTPTPRSRVPAIDTNIAQDFSSSLASPTTPSHNEVPSLRISVSPRTDIPAMSPSTPRTQPHHKINSTNRARTESRKLLAHVLDQLERRALPLGIFDAYDRTEDQGSENNLGALLQSVKGAVNPKKAKLEVRRPSPAGMGEDVSDEGEEHEYSTDATYGLMLQLKELLRVSVDQDWHILDDNPSDQPNEYYEASGKPGISPFRRSRNSLQPGGQRNRSRSPSIDGKRTRTPELLSSCISILASVVLEDCRFQIASPRPSCPPNALQALILDVAQFLLHTHRHDPNITSKIGFAMIPAFSTFRPEMHGRLLTFFETAVIRGVLEDLGQIQGVSDITSNANDFASESTAVVTYHSAKRNKIVAEPLNSAGSSVVAIHIDPVQDLTPHFESEYSQWKPWSISPDKAQKLRSTYAPSQSLTVYLLSSLIAPMLATILEFVDLEPKPDARTDVLHRFRRLLRLIVEIKPDAYSDVLQVVGYHTHQARRTALAILCAVWPKAVGHIAVSRPFVDLYAPDQTGSSPYIPTEHQFIPWRFSSQLASPSSPRTFRHDCRSCSQPIYGFGLMCTLCTCIVHFDCYDHPEGSKLLQYPLASDSGVQRMAVYRFSPVQIGLPKSAKLFIHKHGHAFRPANLFTLCLCIVCRQPLWGCSSQGLNCSSCMLFAHTDCLTSSTPDNPTCSSRILNSNYFNIEWDQLRKTCMEYYSEIFRLSYNELRMLSFEEISVIHSTMWTQAQIISSGIALGSVVVARNGANTDHSGKLKMEEFELHRVIRWCEDLLYADHQHLSNAMDDYMEANSLARSEHFMMFDWTNLMYIRSIIRSPYTEEHIPHGSSTNLLSVSQPLPFPVSASDATSSPFDVVPLSHLRDALGHGLNIHSDVVARLLLSHLHHLGLFQRVDHSPVLFSGDNITDVYCSFPLPFGLDLSPTVEALVAAVEGCLQDLDLSVTEVGLLLLVRRLWPNGLTSDYALQRLTRCVLLWILAEVRELLDPITRLTTTRMTIWL
ncbi:hypothetical protein C0991_003853 [Blastosporella zonata]|nr:hypothetical protein C0991_003853 [Blastosporella zonata]